MTKETLEITEEKKLAEQYLIHYDFYMEQIEQQRDDIIKSSPSIENVPTKNKYKHGNPTCTKAVKLITHSERNERAIRWLKAVDATRAYFASLDTDHGVYITERYDMGLSPGQIAGDIGLGRQALYRLRDEILTTILLAYYKTYEDDGTAPGKSAEE